jgi:hypothetical protein
VAGYGPASVGLSLAESARGDRAAATRARAMTREAIAALEQTGRAQYACVVDACDAAAHGETTKVVDAMERLLSSGPASVLGWTLPVEPCLRPVVGQPGLSRLLASLAERAR